jgi:hypothetical protein
VFAATQVLRAGLGHRKGDGFEFGTFMGAVAEGLVAGTPTGAPPVFARFQFHDAGIFLGYLGFCHNVLVAVVRNNGITLTEILRQANHRKYT